MTRSAPLPLVLVLVAGLASPSAAQTAPAACADSAWIWTAPEPVAWDHPAGMMLTEATAEALGGTQLIAGNVLPVAPEGRTLPRPARLLRIPGGAIPLPEGDFAFVAPRAIPDARGRIHLLWTEPDSATDDPRRFRRDGGGTVMHAALGAGGWSRPKPLPVREPELRGTARTARVDRRGALHVVLPVARTGGDVSMVHLRRHGARWRITRFPTMAASVSLALGPADTVRIAFTAGRVRRDGGRDGNSVWLVTSPDGGRTWGKRALLQESGTRAATRVHLHRAADGGLHLLWGQNLDGGLSPAALRYRWSEDGGRSWRLAPDAPLGGRLRVLAPPLHRAGELLAVAEIRPDTAPAALVLHRWRDGRPSADPLPTGGAGAFDPVLTPLPDGALRLSFVLPGGEIRTMNGRRACTTHSPASPRRDDLA